MARLRNRNRNLPVGRRASDSTLRGCDFPDRYKREIASEDTDAGGVVQMEIRMPVVLLVTSGCWRPGEGKELVNGDSWSF